MKVDSKSNQTAYEYFVRGLAEVGLEDKVNEFFNKDEIANCRKIIEKSIIFGQASRYPLILTEEQISMFGLSRPDPREGPASIALSFAEIYKIRGDSFGGISPPSDNSSLSNTFWLVQRLIGDRKLTKEKMINLGKEIKRRTSIMVCGEGGLTENYAFFDFANTHRCSNRNVFDLLNLMKINIKQNFDRELVHLPVTLNEQILDSKIDTRFLIRHYPVCLYALRKGLMTLTIESVFIQISNLISDFKMGTNLYPMPLIKEIMSRVDLNEEQISRLNLMLEEIN